MSERFAHTSICCNGVAFARRRTTSRRRHVWVAALSTAFFVAFDDQGTAQQDAGHQPFVRVAGQITARASQTPVEVEVGPDEVRLLGASLQVRGLPNTVKLNAGERLDQGTWLVPLAELQFLKVLTPDGLEGTADIEFELVRSSGEVISEAKSQLRIGITQAADRPLVVDSTDTADVKSEIRGFLGRSARFPIAEPSAKRAVAPDLPATPGVPRPTEVARPDQIAQAPAPKAPAAAKEVARAADPKQAAAFEVKGRAAWATGNVAAARLHYGRAVELGSPTAAMALAATYDPNELRAAGVMGVAPEPDTALKWYQKARELGAPEAERRIARLESQ